MAIPTKTPKIPKAAIPLVGALSLGAAYLLYKKHKAKEDEGKVGEANPYLAQSFIPVTAENVAGVGAVRSGLGEENNTALIQAQEENFKTIVELIEDKEANKTERQSSRFSFQQGLREITANLTGGGAPVGQAAANTVVATVAPAVAPVSNTGTTPESTNPCGTEFPLFNPAPGKGCYRISRTTTKGGCMCHGYKNGDLECQQGSGSSCHW